MPRIFALILLVTFLTLCAPLSAQVIDSTVCNILASPQSFDGKIVRIKGEIIAGFEEFSIKGTECNLPVNSIWLAYPEGTKGKAGPAAVLHLQLAKNHSATPVPVNRAAVSLDKNKDFKDFDNFLSTPAKTNGLCMGCVKFTVTATLVGRLDGSTDTGFIRDSTGKVIGVGGFGHLNRYPARLVLQSVSDVNSQEMDYSKPGSAASNNKTSANGTFIPGAPTADQLKRGVDAFGAPGEDNGVGVGFSGANEIPRNDTAKSN
jgi:hypothetical protein